MQQFNNSRWLTYESHMALFEKLRWQTNESQYHEALFEKSRWLTYESQYHEALFEK